MNPEHAQDDRQRYWQRKLGRLRLGVEPIEVQLERYRRVTWLLTAIPFGLAIFIITLFTAFRRPDIGVILALILFIPVVSIAWIDFAVLRSRAMSYLEEFRGDEARGEPLVPVPVERR